MVDEAPAAAAVDPAPPLFARRVRYRFAVCCNSLTKLEPLIELDRLIAKATPAIRLVEVIDGTEAGLIVAAEQDSSDDEAIDQLIASGSRMSKFLSEQDMESLPRLDSECRLEWSYPGDDPLIGLLAAATVTHELAVLLKGVIRDDTTGQYFSPATWNERRIQSWRSGDPDVRRQILIEISNRPGGLLSAHTRGMAKIGLPDLVIGDFPTSHLRSVGNTVVVLAQGMIERQVSGADGPVDLDMRAIRNPDVRDPQVSHLEPGATGVLLLNLNTARGHGPRRCTVSFERGSGPDAVSRMTDVLSRAFGAQDSTVKTVHDEDVQAASEQARARLPLLREEFEAGLPTGELLLLKAPFKTTDEGNEFMWIEVAAWSDESIAGFLMNEPHSVPDLHAGQRVEIEESAVFDYIRRHADGSQEGNSTAAHLRRQNPAPADQ